MSCQVYEVTVYENCTEWRQKGQYHRIDGPAIEWDDGSKFWYQNGKRHRTDGPAVEYADGTKEWWVNGKYHRTDGPAFEYANGYKDWYLEGVYHTEAEFNAKMNPDSSYEGKVVEIEGKSYRLVEE